MIKVTDSNITIIPGLDKPIVLESGLIEKGYDCGVDKFLNVCQYNPNFYCYTVLDINIPIAYFICESCYGFEDYLWVHLMYVTPDYRGNKLPEMMMRGMIDGLEPLGLKKIKAQIGEKPPEWWTKVAGVDKLDCSNVVTYNHGGL